METNLSSWFPNQLSHQQLSYFNSLNYPFNLGSVNDILPPSMSPCANIASPNGNTLNYEKAAYFPRETNAPNPGPGPAQKKFLVFDQSGDQTTFFFSPGIGPPLQLPSTDPKLNYNHHIKNMVEKTDIFQHKDPILTYEYHGKLRDDDVESEMREDTEEINALLYSDDEYYEDEEEESTGHSPSTMTEFEDDNEEIGSNFGPNKRIKLSKDYSKCEDDAESSCDNENNHDLGGKKRIMKDQIRDTVSLLQSIIPGGKGNGNESNDTILILDEAIDYLKSLKVKAQALGVHTI